MKNQVGILGGGQLALMLAQSAVSQGLIPIIYADHESAPAARVYSNTVIGSVKDEKALSHFFSKVSHVVFENEFVDCAVIRRASLLYPHLQFYPSLKTIELLQDKLNQKKILRELEISTPEFVEIDSGKSIQKQLLEASQYFKNGFVIKWARNGYDGKGVFIPKQKAFEEYSQDALRFCASAIETDNFLYLEEKIQFRRELALVSVRSVSGDWVSYPLVVSEQKDGICWRVYGPATAVGVSSELETQAKQAAQKLAEAVQLQGVFALEFFETETGKLSVNEIAPRVHNSGHYSQNACDTDQFENHWRAVLGMPLGLTHASPAFAMLNVLGPPEGSPRYNDLSVPLATPRSHVHWYSKTEFRPGRKLGHLNGTVSRPEDLAGLLHELEIAYREWSTGER
jgi:5-(carboxyamino)imidazole ribonucleotide synthase